MPGPGLYELPCLPAQDSDLGIKGRIFPLGVGSSSELYDVVGFDFDMFWLDRNFESEHLQSVSQESPCSENFRHREESGGHLCRTVSISQECQVRDAVELGRADKVDLGSHDGHVIETRFVAS